MTATEESLELPLNTALKENWVKPAVEFPSAQRLISVNSRSLTFGVLMIWPGLKYKIGHECQGKFFNICMVKLLTSLSRWCKLEIRGNPNRNALMLSKNNLSNSDLKKPFYWKL